jgi:hypothetical protein
LAEMERPVTPWWRKVQTCLFVCTESLSAWFYPY